MRLNRAERRRVAKIAHSPAPVYHPNPIQQEYDRVLDNVKWQSTEQALVLTFAVPLMVLYRDYGWRAGRLPKYAERLTDEYQRFFDGKTDLKQYAKQVSELTGIHFELGDFDGKEAFRIER